MLKQACEAFSRKNLSLSTIAFAANFQQNRNSRPASFLQNFTSRNRNFAFSGIQSLPLRLRNEGQTL
jgi:hypothetical protein